MPGLSWSRWTGQRHRTKTGSQSLSRSRRGKDVTLRTEEDGLRWKEQNAGVQRQADRTADRCTPEVHRRTKVASETAWVLRPIPISVFAFASRPSSSYVVHCTIREPPLSLYSRA